MSHARFSVLRPQRAEATPVIDFQQYCKNCLEVCVQCVTNEMNMLTDDLVICLNFDLANCGD